MMNLLKLDKSFAIGYVKDIHYEEVNMLRVYACKFGYIILMKSGDYVLTDKEGVYLLTH